MAMGQLTEHGVHGVEILPVGLSYNMYVGKVQDRKEVS